MKLPEKFTEAMVRTELWPVVHETGRIVTWLAWLGLF